MRLDTDAETSRGLADTLPARLDKTDGFFAELGPVAGRAFVIGTRTDQSCVREAMVTPLGANTGTLVAAEWTFELRPIGPNQVMSLDASSFCVHVS